MIVVEQPGTIEGLVTALLRHEREDPSDGIPHSNIGGWRSRHDLEKWPDPPVQAAIRVMTEAGARFLGVSRTWAWAWANVLRAGHSVKPHAHQTAGRKPGVTAVYYPQAGVRGAGGELIVEGEAIQPEDGMLVLFPTGTTHWVVEYTGSVPRISIAANLLELREKRQRRIHPPAR